MRILLVISFGLLLATAQAQELVLPTEPSQWVNSAPITLESLKGKAALLWFFEEECPRCRGKWPEMVALSKKYEGKPIAFIAVNSGNFRPEVASYLQETSVPWPTIVDPLRQFEKICGVNEISLQNIYQAVVITPDGRLRRGDSSNLEGTVESALKDAKWNVDPASIPTPLKKAWQAIEFGDYAGGATLVKKGLTAGKQDIKQAATTLNDFVKARIDEELAAAKKTQEGGDKWRTFRAFQSIADRFAGYEVPEEVAATVAELAKDEKVKKQQALLKQLTGAKKSLTSTSRAGRAGAINRLKKIVEEAPESDAGQEAAELLKDAGK